MIKIIKDHVPVSSKKRTQIAMRPVYITVHSTANPTSTAKNERAWLTNPSNTSSTGFHYAVDEKEAVECIPPSEVAWHAGDGNGQGNRASIGVEICESGNRQKTLDNAVELIQHLMKTHNITKVVRHYDWSRKNCPRILNTDKKWTLWNDFYNRVMNKEIKVDSQYEKSVKELMMLDIIGSPAAWLDTSKVTVNNVKSLIIKFGRRIDDKVKDYNSAVDVLVKVKIISNKQAWSENNINTKNVVPLIIKMSAYITQGI